MEEVVNDSLGEKWTIVQNRMRAFERSFKQAKIPLDEWCLYDLLPNQFLLSYYDVKNQITEHIFDNYDKPEIYDHLVNIHKLSKKVHARPLNIDKKYLREVYFDGGKKLLGKVNAGKTRIEYDPFSTKTGRLTVTPESFPILTLPKRLRSVLRPTNDLFVEIDYNSAEIRTMLALAGHEQPPGDIHEWNRRNVWNDEIDRDEAKRRMFSWLFSSKTNDALQDVYKPNEVVPKYWDGKVIETPFGRVIESDDFHALNYLVQSTNSDLFLECVCKVDELLSNGTDSHVAFTIHDSVVLDMSKKDLDKLGECITLMKNTRLGVFMTNVKIGLTFGNLVEKPNSGLK